MKGTVISLERKAEKMRKELEQLQHEIEKKKDSLVNGDVFRCTFIKKGANKDTYRIYIYTPTIDSATGKTKANCIHLGNTKSQEAIEFAMRVLRQIENTEILSKVLDIVTRMKDESGQGNLDEDWREKYE